MVAALAAEWIRLRGQQDQAQASNQAEAEQWLKDQGYQAAIASALTGVLLRLWTAAWKIGLAGAKALAGAAFVSSQALVDLLNTYAAEWAGEIAGTVVGRLAAVLAGGGTGGQLVQALAAVLGDEAAARRIAQTEVTRGSGAAAYAWYQAASVPLVRWITEPPDPCPICVRNSQAAPRSLGVPFPSGAVKPPEHPHCRCALVPA